ncbi:hypothetical protein KKF84_06690, partial [Myxococcota bacterium]|nr:hypothetical protein [Myxococcota bacterium]
MNKYFLLLFLLLNSSCNDILDRMFPDYADPGPRSGSLKEGSIPPPSSPRSPVVQRGTLQLILENSKIPGPRTFNESLLIPYLPAEPEFSRCNEKLCVEASRS